MCLICYSVNSSDSSPIFQLHTLQHVLICSQKQRKTSVAGLATCLKPTNDLRGVRVLSMIQPATSVALHKMTGRSMPTRVATAVHLQARSGHLGHGRKWPAVRSCSW